jgi:PAS domain S-box-containing protein
MASESFTAGVVHASLALTDLADSSDRSPVFVFGISSDGCICMHNGAFEESSGFDPSELANRSITEMCADAENQDRCQQMIENVTTSKEIRNFVLALSTKNSTKLEIIVLNATMSTHSDGLASSIIVFAKEAKDHMMLKPQAHVPLVQAELLKLISEPIFGVDQRGIIDVWNHRLSAITDIPAEVSMAR